MHELTIKHIGNHYQFLHSYPIGGDRHLGYSKNISSKDLIQYYLEIQECNWFFNHPKFEDDIHNIYLNGKNINCEKVDGFESLEDAVEYLTNFKKEFEHLFEEKNSYTI
jgi:hypothetical protein